MLSMDFDDDPTIAIVMTLVIVISRSFLWMRWTVFPSQSYREAAAGAGFTYSFGK